MHSEIDILVDKFIDVVKEIEQNKQVRSIKQYHKDRSKGYKTISCVIEYEKYKVRFAYHVNEGVVFKKGIITLYFNIGNIEYHFSDILSYIAPKDKEIIVFPYVDNVDTMKLCVQLLWDKLQKYSDKITELASDEEQKNKLERNLRKEIKVFSGKDLPNQGPLVLMLSGIYANTSLIRYTSEPYECFVNGNYKKSIKLYNKEANLSLYEQQLVKLMKRSMKTNKKTEIPENQKTINHINNMKKNSRVYNVLSFLLLLPIMLFVCFALSKLFVNVITMNSLAVLTQSYMFLTVPAIALSIAFTKTVRDYLFKNKLNINFQYQVLISTQKYKKLEKSIFNSIIIASIITIALIAASSISIREDGIKYSKDILDFKGTIVPYNEVQKVDIDNKKIILKNNEEILLDTFNCSVNDLKLIDDMINNN